LVPKSIKMTSSTIIDLLPIFRRDVLRGVNDGSSDVPSIDRSRIFSHGCREDICSRNIYPVCYILDNSDLYSWVSGNVNQVVRLLFPDILVLVLLPMVTDLLQWMRVCM
jgi:hypothetical protein